MSRFDPQLVCCVCGCKIPYEKKEILLQRGCGTQLGTGQVVWHCRMPIHSPEQIVGMLNAVPRFVTAKEYSKPLYDR